MKDNQIPEYQTPRVDILSLHQEGVLCASGEMDKFTIDNGLGLEDF